ncbi:hypothetical protein K432DRAFT_403562 [Lepidopterella palustris CBS 459.81]|uniref:VIT domain-containing protein n=1 Tax=Lepidopterella palustris CBS 459.81 TaxID=1314670 RepID=A0A8E2EDB2_9PEZI|nr:hypothetical protein K432DRAFT_403562 [Lepidopterella palustris CBS 459.81]
MSDWRPHYLRTRQRSEARQTYERARKRGKRARLLEQLPEASDVFTTMVSNIPDGDMGVAMIAYIGELKHDAEVEQIQCASPTAIAPRYGCYPGSIMNAESFKDKGISITVDITARNGAPIQKIQSPSHLITVSWHYIHRSF